MANNKSPYELAGRKKGLESAPDRPARAGTLTEAEQKEKLTGYVPVPPDLWPFVKYSTHVRYVVKSGEFRQGGFVLNNPFDTKVQGTAIEKRFIKLQNGFNKSARDYKTWIAAYEDIEYLYVKGTGVELALQRDLQTAATTLSKNIQRLAKYYEELERRIAELEGRPCLQSSRGDKRSPGPAKPEERQ